MKIKVLWQSYYDEVPRYTYWDMTMLLDLFYGTLWDAVCSPQYENICNFDAIEPGEGAVVIIPARYHYKDVDRINADLARLPWVILMIVGDEESTFPTDKISHPNMKLWVMTPIPGRHKADHYLIHGYTPDCRTMLAKLAGDDKSRAWFFAGQATHRRREECLAQLEKREDGYLLKTAGFAMGMGHEDYFLRMASSKVIPCPSGPATPDSFRVAEALEAGCVPMADECTPEAGYPEGYWTNVFGATPPFSIIRDWGSFGGYLKDLLNTWPDCANKVFAWWQGYKRKMAYDVIQDLSDLGVKPEAPGAFKDLVTVLISTSPIPSHPSTEIIEETIGTVRRWLPESEIIIMIDGIRDSQKSLYGKSYGEYVRRLLWKCNHQWKNILPVFYGEHHHQAAMTRQALDLVKTPMILFVEHDTPLIVDHAIDWANLFEVVLHGHVDMIRFHYDARIYDEHWPLMLDPQPVLQYGIPFIRTIQWSQRPHLASTSFYRRSLRDNFSPTALTMIEDRMHSVVQHHCADNPINGWNDYRLAIYVPEGYMQRSYHLDGRRSDSKFEDKFTY